ncbi:carboxypeptidase-like regulatory domain-containing protein, partial [Bacteroides heparinolyticus]
MTDSEGEPLPGATVRVQGLTIGTSADADGHYVLSGKW